LPLACGRLSQYLRPPLLQIRKSEHVSVEGITLTNSPFWTLHPLYSTNLFFKGLTIINPKDAPNSDGIDVDSCQTVHITGCLIDVGDDGIVLKSGSGEDGIKTNIPTNNVRIEHCTVKNAHGGAVIGSETAGGISTIHVSDCFFDGTDRGIRIKTRRGRGGKITNLVFSDIRMQDNLCPLTLNMYYRCGSDNEEDFSLEKLVSSSTTPSLSGGKRMKKDGQTTLQETSNQRESQRVTAKAKSSYGSQLGSQFRILDLYIVQKRWGFENQPPRRGNHTIQRKNPMQE